MVAKIHFSPEYNPFLHLIGPDGRSASCVIPTLLSHWLVGPVQPWMVWSPIPTLVQLVVTLHLYARICRLNTKNWSRRCNLLWSLGCILLLCALKGLQFILVTLHHQESNSRPVLYGGALYSFWCLHLVKSLPLVCGPITSPPYRLGSGYSFFFTATLVNRSDIYRIS